MECPIHKRAYLYKIRNENGSALICCCGIGQDGKECDWGYETRDHSHIDEWKDYKQEWR
jgi:hypothetical protein